MYILLAVKPSLNSCWIITERMIAFTVMKLIVFCLCQLGLVCVPHSDHIAKCLMILNLLTAHKSLAQ